MVMGKMAVVSNLKQLIQSSKSSFMKSMDLSAQGQHWIYVSIIIITIVIIVAMVMTVHLTIGLWDLGKSLRFP